MFRESYGGWYSYKHDFREIFVLLEAGWLRREFVYRVSKVASSKTEAFQTYASVNWYRFWETCNHPLQSLMINLSFIVNIVKLAKFKRNFISYKNLFHKTLHEAEKRPDVETMLRTEYLMLKYPQENSTVSDLIFQYTAWRR